MARTVRTKVFKFKELNEDAKNKAIESFRNFLVDGNWWSDMYADAKDIGLHITSFDIDKKGITSHPFEPIFVATKVIANHGEDTATYKVAKDYLNKVKSVVDSKHREDDNIDEEFMSAIMEEYLILLGKEYEWLTSREAIVDFINANEYEFYANGKQF